MEGAVLQVGAEDEAQEAAVAAGAAMGRPQEVIRTQIRDDFLLFSIDTTITKDGEFLELQQYGCSCTGQEKSSGV